MRRHCLMLTLLCLSAPRAAGAEGTGFPPWPECYEGVTSESVARKREAFRNPDKLKAELLRFLPINGRFDFTEFPWFKKTFDVQDEFLRPVLLEISGASLKRPAITQSSDRFRHWKSHRPGYAPMTTPSIPLVWSPEASDVRALHAFTGQSSGRRPREAKNSPASWSGGQDGFPRRSSIVIMPEWFLMMLILKKKYP